MVSIVSSVAYLGLDARAVEVQVQLIPGLPAFNVVGLGGKEVSESRERVRGAVASMGLSLPPKRIAVNLSPADLPRKDRTSTCRSRWRCSARWGSSMSRRWRSTSSLAS
jgi:magnesium chelatase family protein